MRGSGQGGSLLGSGGSRPPRARALAPAPSRPAFPPPSHQWETRDAGAPVGRGGGAVQQGLPCTGTGWWGFNVFFSGPRESRLASEGSAAAPASSLPASPPGTGGPFAAAARPGPPPAPCVPTGPGLLGRARPARRAALRAHARCGVAGGFRGRGGRRAAAGRCGPLPEARRGPRSAREAGKCGNTRGAGPGRPLGRRGRKRRGWVRKTAVHREARSSRSLGI